MSTFNDSSIMEQELRRERVFDGIILHIDHTINKLPNGKEAAREIAMHIGASAVLPVDADGNVYLVRQFRAPIGKILLEIPAGKLDAPDEDRKEAAVRELREETGYTADRWQLLSDIYTTPGFTNEKISVFLATDLHAGECAPDDDEFLNIVKMPYTEAFNMAQRGEITDSKTAIALCLAKQYL